MPTLARLASLEAAVFFAALAAIVCYQILTGRIHLTGLLRDKTRRNQLSPARIQLLLVTIFGAGMMLRSAAGQGALTLLPPEVVALFGASHGLYLGNKYLNRGALRSQNAADRQ
jgi:hypothetical protein